MSHYTYTTKRLPAGRVQILRNGTPAATVDDESQVPPEMLQLARMTRQPRHWLGDLLAAVHEHALVAFQHRFVVVLAVGYAESDAATPAIAADLALDLTRDEESHGTVWIVYDRLTSAVHHLQQRDFEGSAG